MVEMGDLRKLHMKESQKIMNQKYATSENAYGTRTVARKVKKKMDKQLDENGKRATFWNHDYKVGMKIGESKIISARESNEYVEK